MQYLDTIIYILWLVFVVWKQVNDVANMKKRIEQLDTTLKDYTFIEKELSRVAAKIDMHDVLLNNMNIQLATISQSLEYLKPKHK